MLVCDFCSSQSDLSYCRCFHSFCDECAMVSCEPDTTHCVFCPKCSVECAIQTYVASVGKVETEPKSEQALENTPPSEYICPITHELMINPVVLSDGFSYEMHAIAKWIRIKAISPITGANVESMIIPNTVLRILINEWKEKNMV